MSIPEYVTVKEVRKVCRELGIRDWTKLKDGRVRPNEAKAIRSAVGGEALRIPVEEFLGGLEVELEHGRRCHDANVTNNHPVLTGKIVLAHLRETLDYYIRLEIMELEGDLHKALRKGKSAGMLEKYGKLMEARAKLSASERRR